jgi:23S rRNA (adenine2503-C2)-methyltransferase
MAAGKIRLKDLIPDELEQFFRDLGEAPYRARQLGAWVYRRRATAFPNMTDLSVDLRTRLTEVATIQGPVLARELVAEDGCRKFLFRFADGATAETVFIPDHGRRAVCISPQTGCALGCRFCATGLAGPGRNLTAGEIVDQILTAPVPLPTHVVVMGMGEPLLNLDSTIRALRILTWPHGLGIGPRRITVSTIGIPDGIRALASVTPPVGLAISINAATDELRRELMPSAHPLARTLDAAREFCRTTRRTVTLEYVLLPDVNNTPRQVEYLARWARGLASKVNIIQYNPVEGAPYRTATEEELQSYARQLWERSIRVTVRRSRGASIRAACGQLAGTLRPTDQRMSTERPEDPRRNAILS